MENLERLLNRVSSQANTTGTQNPSETEYNTLLSCKCDRWSGDMQHLLKTCHLYEDPFTADCAVIKQKWEVKLRQAGVYERFHRANLPQIEARGIPASVNKEYRQVVAFTQDLPQKIKQGQGLIFLGPVGTMKTTLAVAVLQEALWQGYGGMKILMQSLLDEIFTRKARSLQDWLSFEERLRNCSLLVVDELGKHSSEGWVMTKFDSIVSERHERKKSTIFVTNLSPGELRGLYSEGVIDRFNQANDIITFRGDSLRQKGD